MRRSTLIYPLIVLLSLPAIISFLHPGFMVTDDGGWMVIRLAAFYDAFRDGQFPVRWTDTLNFGYGYPVVNFLYPGFLYLGVPLVLIFSNFVFTIKVLFVASIIAGSVGMYLWLSKRFDSTSSFFGSMIYTYLPYHLYTVTVRGSLGEVLVLGVLPFLMYAIESRKKLLVSLLFALLLVSHNILALLFSPLVLLYALLNKSNSQEKYFDIFLPLILGMGISFFFWIPALIDLPETRFFQTNISNYQEYFAPLNIIGLASLIIIVIGLALILKEKKKNPFSKESLFILFATLSIFMASSFSKPIWGFLPVGFVQFPFRFLGLAVFSLGFVSSFILSNLKLKRVVFIPSLLIVFILSFSLIFPKEYSNFPDSYYFTNQSTTTIKNEYMPIAVKQDPLNSEDELVSSSGLGHATLKAKSSKRIAIEVDGITGPLVVNQLYFPGWKGYVDGKEMVLDVQKDSGKMQIDIPSGSHLIEFIFKETPLRLVADIISIMSFLCSVWLFKLSKYAKRKK